MGKPNGGKISTSSMDRISQRNQMAKMAACLIKIRIRVDGTLRSGLSTNRENF